MTEFLEILLDTVLDVIKQLPFLFVAFLLMEFIENKMNDKTQNIILKAGRFGPIAGGILGGFPQCGFSTMASNLYATRLITVGTLIAVYLSTSDEMIVIMMSEPGYVGRGFIILGIKVVYGIICGLIIDAVMRTKHKDEHEKIEDFCKSEHCHCGNGILRPAIFHTLKIAGFIAAITLLLNMAMNYFGNDAISKLMLGDSVFSSFITSLIALIPNCGSSVAITELYIKGSISFGACVGGLLAGSGVGMLVLFKTNKPMKQNFAILGTVYAIGAVTGLLMDVIGIAL